MDRILFPLACALLVLAAPARAHALVKPLCSTVTCQGGAPAVSVGLGGLSHPEIIPIFWGQYWNAPTDVTVCCGTSPTCNTSSGTCN
jgi:hypothetical protein